jgi:hypothetical protein
MKNSYPVPASVNEAEAHLAAGCNATLSNLTIYDFITQWCALAYLEPGLHPDGYELEDSGWPENLKPYAAEAWRRHELGELSSSEFYCSYATWAGVYDRMNSHTQEEQQLREQISRGEF